MISPGTGNKDSLDRQRLVEDHFLGCLSDNQSAELETMLLDDQALRNDFRQAATLDSALRDIALRQAAESVLSQSPSRSSRRARFGRVAVMAGLVLAVVAIWLGINRLRYPTVAALTAVTGDVIARANTRILKARSGRRLWSGMEIEASGGHSSAVVVWKDGSRMKLAGNTRLSIAVLDGRKRVALSIGMIDCDIRKQPQGKPLIISTPQSRLEIIGTHFRTRVTSSQATTEVTQGQVRVERVSDGKSVMLTAREKITVNGKSELEKEIFYWSDRFRGGASGQRRISSAIFQQTEGFEIESRRSNSRFKGAERTRRNNSAVSGVLE